MADGLLGGIGAVRIIQTELAFAQYVERRKVGVGICKIAPVVEYLIG